MAVKKRKRKKRYHTGVHVSTKTGLSCKYRSGWELSYMQYLDSDASTVWYGYEAVMIDYVSNLRTGKLRRYYPDFLVLKADGSQVLIEIKPKKRLDQTRVQKKLKAAEGWASAHGVSFVVITEYELRQLGLLK